MPLTLVGLLLVATTGCSSGPDSLMKEQISLMNDLAAAIEKKESPEKIKAIEEKMKAAKEKFDKLNLSDDEKKKLAEKYKNEIVAATERMAKATLGQMGSQFGEMINKAKNMPPP